ncbi:hypothetical protein LCGC14_0732070 [marine sediment metagenome]|uniref:Uncharacterized protein n=1 Tax=marine sediment metagenome TaxID=412755 RepID=A0A0F9SUF3_9ZZZZ
MLKRINQKSLKEIVEEILEKDKRAREDSAWLLYKVWRRYTKIFIPFENFKNLPSPEGIMRVRRILRNQENKFNEDEDIQEGVTYEKPSMEIE